MQNFEVRDMRVKEKFYVDDAYLNGYARLCGIQATGVYLSLCRHANKSQISFPSKALMARELGIGERSVYRGMTKLEEWGIIKKTQAQNSKSGKFMFNTYLLLDKKQWRPKPQAISAYGEPQANRATTVGHMGSNRRPLVPTKDTHLKDTHIKVSLSLKEEERNRKIQEMKSNLLGKSVIR